MAEQLKIQTECPYCGTKYCLELGQFLIVLLNTTDIIHEEFSLKCKVCEKNIVIKLNSDGENNE